MFLLHYPDVSHNLPIRGKLRTDTLSECGVTLTKRDCNHIHGSGQPVLPTLDLSGGSIHSHS
jgi:hypothetical protein